MLQQKKQHNYPLSARQFGQIIAFLILILPPSVSVAQTAHQLSRQADKDFNNDKYKEAELNYRRAQEQKRDDRTAYNLGNTVYKQQRYDEALEHYGKIADKTTDKSLKGNSLYNQGNAHFYKKEYEKAIDAYKKTLRLNPQDFDAKKNLALAKRFLEKQNQEKEKQKQQNKDQNQDQNKQNQDQQNQNQQNQNQDQNKQNQDQPNQQNQNQNGQNQPNNGQNPQNQQGKTGQEGTPQDLKKEDAKRMLQIMDDEERKVQQRLQKGKAEGKQPKKDW